uniref:Uncharacterized protein n=1 Tax=Ascaris lumbricoides TaxID=6252 RepID=A0A0M3HUG5_ASCLU
MEDLFNVSFTAAINTLKKRKSALLNSITAATFTDNNYSNLFH